MRTARVVAADNDIRMIILNLVQNAFHAMPQGGVLTVSTHKTGDDQVEIRVGDSGCGINTETLPLFSIRFSAAARI
ncbi:MAG: ATP-binding protein [Thiolinea sp.]